MIVHTKGQPTEDGIYLVRVSNPSSEWDGEKWVPKPDAGELHVAEALVFADNSIIWSWLGSDYDNFGVDPIARYELELICRLDLDKIAEGAQTDRLAPIWGARFRKKSGSWWEGRLVGTYSTQQTPEGYCIQLDNVENGPVQIYPASALEPVPR